jgi:hypothetical protein
MRLLILDMSSRNLIAAIFVASLSSCATDQPGVLGQRVILSQPFEIVQVNSLPSMISWKLESLSEIDPDHPIVSDGDTQTLSLFGREDLIAASSDDYKPTNCSPSALATAALDEIVRRAEQTSIVIINESHERSRHRWFTAEVARRLRPLGYDTLGLETLSNPPATVPQRYLPSLLGHPDLPYLSDDDGHYSSEAGYGRLGRQAKALGYRLLPYEDNTHNEPSKGVSQSQQIALREEAQANNLAAFVKSHPAAKLLIHVGYSHATEVPRADGQKWMAARLKEKTGIDPLTISQTTCRGGSETMRLATLPSDQPAGTFDLIIDHPTERFTRGRPDWRKMAGDRIITIPRKLRPAKGWRVIEARPLGESDTSVPIDRVAIRPGEDIGLLLPPGRYHVRAIDVVYSAPK